MDTIRMSTNTCVLLLSIVTLSGCMQVALSDETQTDTFGQEVDSAECEDALSSPYGHPHGQQLHSEMASSFLNLTVMVDNTHLGPHPRALRIVLSNWLGDEPIRLQEMLVLMTSSEGTTSDWSKCLKITLHPTVKNDKDRHLSVMIPTHQNISSYRMTLVSVLCDDQGLRAVGRTVYLIKMAEYTTNRDWILPVIAHTSVEDKVVFSVTPPSPRLHRNLLKCSTWLITCGGRQLGVPHSDEDPDQSLLVAPKGMADPPDDKGHEHESADVQRSDDEWGMGNCLFYDSEMLLKSSLAFPILNIKVPKGTYQIWIDCVLQNPISSWPSQSKTIRTPTFTHAGKDEFFITVKWKDGEKRDEVAANVQQQYIQHTEYPPSNHFKSESKTSLLVPVEANSTMNDNSNDGNNHLILIVCCVSGAAIAALLIGIGALLLYVTRISRRKHRMFGGNPSNTGPGLEFESLQQQHHHSPHTNRCPHNCLTMGSPHSSCTASTADSSISLDEDDDDDDHRKEEEPSAFPNDSFLMISTPPLHRYKQTSMDITAASSSSFSTDSYVKSLGVRNGCGGGDFHYYIDDNGANDDDDDHRDTTEVLPFQSSNTLCSRVPPVHHNIDEAFLGFETNSFSLSNIHRKTLDGVGCLSANNNCSSLGYHSCKNNNHFRLPPIKSPKVLPPAVRADSMKFNNLLDSFNNCNVNDWKRNVDGRSEVINLEECVSVGDPVSW